MGNSASFYIKKFEKKNIMQIKPKNGHKLPFVHWICFGTLATAGWKTFFFS